MNTEADLFSVTHPLQNVKDSEAAAVQLNFTPVNFLSKKVKRVYLENLNDTVHTTIPIWLDYVLLMQ